MKPPSECQAFALLRPAWGFPPALPAAVRKFRSAIVLGSLASAVSSSLEVARQSSCRFRHYLYWPLPAAMLPSDCLLTYFLHQSTCISWAFGIMGRQRRFGPSLPVPQASPDRVKEKSSSSWMCCRLSFLRSMSYLPLLSFGPSATVPGLVISVFWVGLFRTLGAVVSS